MTDNKDGRGDGKDEKDGIVVSFEEFLRKAEKRNAAEAESPRPPKTAEEMVAQLCKLLGLVADAHDALFKLYKMQSIFMIEHMDPLLLKEYLATATPLQAFYRKKIELLSNPPL